MEGKQRFMLNLPPGFHFSPTDPELIVHYLRRKLAGLPPHLPIFKDVTPIIGHRPEDLTAKFRDHGEDRWYFFTKRNRKYSSGNRPERTTPGKGFWKATGPQKRIRVGGELVGRVRLLVFYTGQEEVAASPTEKTYWTMHEYENITSEEEDKDKNIDKLDEWVLCTIEKQKNRCFDEKKEEGSRAPVGGGDKIKKGKAKGEGKAGGKKRKGKAEKGTHQVDIWRSEVREKGEEMDMFDLEQTSCNKKRPQIQQQDEPPRSDAMVVDGYDYGPSMAPSPPPHSEMMAIPHCEGYDMGSAGIPSFMSQLSAPEMVSRPGTTAYRLDEYMPPQEYEMAPDLGIGYNNYNMAYQPATTSYLNVAAPLGAFGYGYGYSYSGTAAHQLAGHRNNVGYAAGGHPGSFLGTGNSSYAFPQHSYAAAGTNNLAVVKGAMSSQVGL